MVCETNEKRRVTGGIHVVFGGKIACAQFIMYTVYRIRIDVNLGLMNK